MMSCVSATAERSSSSSLAAWSHLLSQAGFNGYPVGKDSQSNQFHAHHVGLGMAVAVRVREQ